MKKEIVEKVENQTPEQEAERAKEVEEFVKKDYAEHRKMMDALGAGFEERTVNVQVFSRIKLQKYLYKNKGFLNNTWIISFFGLEEAKANFRGINAHVLQVCVDDIRFSENAKEYYSQHLEDFKMIADFIKQGRENNGNYICSCECGYSRSAGCAKAILEFYDRRGYEIDQNIELNPNPWVYEKILTVLKQGWFNLILNN